MKLNKLDLGQAERHEFLVKIAIVKPQRVSFQAIGFETQRDKEVTGFFVSEHNTQVDLLEVG